MSRLNNVLKNNVNGGKPQKKIKIPEYGTNGKVLKVRNEGLIKDIKIVFIVVLFLFMVLYIPGLFMNKKEKNENNYVYTPDAASIKIFNDYYSKSKEEDFDGDGLSNSAEEEHNINPWDQDTDGDGLNDYYELYITKTSPTEDNTDTIITIQQDQDNQQNITVDTPYKCGNVILWADDYKSKARGGVIDVPIGYHFNNFKGYAQFPHTQPIYVYTNDNGIYELLNYNDEADVWKINNVHNVFIYNSPIENVVEYKFFKKIVYGKRNAFGNVMLAILPSRGFITANKTTREDVEPHTPFMATSDNFDIYYDVENGERFGQNTDSLQDLQFVRAMIDENKCVEVSLYDVNDGEFRGIIYGYTNDDTLLVADEQTHEYIGTIYVNEIGEKAIDKNGNYGLNSYFKWYGLGFSSSSYDRISFFSVANDVNDINVTQGPVEATMTDAEEELTTEQNEVTTEEVITEKTEKKEASPTDADYTKALHTGEWDHTKNGFITVMTKYEYTDKTEGSLEKELYKDMEIDSYTKFTSSDEKITVTYFWIPKHDDADKIYENITDLYVEDAKLEESETEVYKQIKYINKDSSVIIIRKYIDDTCIMIESKDGINKEVSKINKAVGQKAN